MSSAVGAVITRTSARTLYWIITTDDTATDVPSVAILAPSGAPTTTTTWHTAAWAGPEVVTGLGTDDEQHTRRLSLLVAGPDGPQQGGPATVTTTGEHSTWVRVATATDTVEVEADLLLVKPS